MVDFVPAVLMAPAMAVAATTLVTKWQARRELELAVSMSEPEARTRLRRLMEADDAAGVIAILRTHLPDLPARQRIQVDAALSQPSEAGRRTYAQGVTATALRLSRR